MHKLRTAPLPILLLALEPISCFKDPSYNHQRCRHKRHGHDKTNRNTNVGQPIETPSEAANQIKHGIEQGDFLPDRRQHLYRIKATAKEGQGCNDEQRYKLQFLKTISPEANDETN